MKEKTVKDLMLPLDEYATVSARSTIREALTALDKAQLGLDFDRHNHRAVLVLDEAGQVVGKLSHWAILRSLEPKFLQHDDLASLARAGLTPEFVQSLQERFSGMTGSLTRMCLEASRLEAREAMVPTGESIDEDAPLTEAIRLMVLHHEQSKLVTKKNEVVGILRLTDVFDEVADIIRGFEPE